MSNNLPKSELVAFVATEANVSKAQAQAVLDALGPVVRTNAANGYAISLPGLGRFIEKTRAARNARNPRTGEVVAVPETTALTFKAARSKAA